MDISSLRERFKTDEKVLDYLDEFYPEIDFEIEPDIEGDVLTMDGDIDDLVLLGNHIEDTMLYADEQLTIPFMHPNYRPN